MQNFNNPYSYSLDMYNMTSAAFIINVSSLPKCHLGIWLPAGFLICMLPFNLLPFRGLHILTAECFVHNIPKRKISFQWHVLDVDGFQHYDSLVQDCSNSSGLAMELLQSCTKIGVQFLWNNFAMHLKFTFIHLLIFIDSIICHIKYNHWKYVTTLSCWVIIWFGYIPYQ